MRVRRPRSRDSSERWAFAAASGGFSGSTAAVYTAWLTCWPGSRHREATAPAYPLRVTSKRPSRRTKADVVYEAIHDSIVAGDLRPGEHLGQEEVAARWDVSQTPVREAFRRLESEGFIAYAANRGVVVRGVPIAPPAAPLAVLARRWDELTRDPDSVPQWAR